MTGSFVITTYPDAATAATVAETLVKKKLAACANITQVRSIYVWQGRVEDTAEFLVILKTLKHKVSSLRDAIEKTHPYEVPEVVELPIESMNKKYSDWLTESVS